MSTAELLTLTEIARRLLISGPTIGNWKSRYDDFPLPMNVDGKRELYSIKQIEEFMQLTGLAGRSKESKTHAKYGVDHTSIAYLIELLSPTYRPEEALLYLLVRVWNLMQPIALNSDSKLVELVRSIGTISILADLVEKGLSNRDSTQKNQSEIIDRGIKIFASDKELRQRFVNEFRELWSQAGRTRAAFTSPEVLSELMAMLAPGDSVLDPCSGLGSTLSKFRTSSIRIAQEIDEYAGAALYLLLNIEGTSAEIHIEDSIATLHREWLYRFDSVIAVPPSRTRDISIDEDDPRWQQFRGIRLQTDEIWILNTLAYLNPNGLAVIGLPTSWMTSSSTSTFRKTLVLSGLVRTVISMGRDLFSDNRVPMTLLILSSQPKPNERIRLIDARQIGNQSLNHRELRSSDLQSIVELVRNGSDDFSSIDVAPDELVSNGTLLDCAAFRVNRPIKFSLRDLQLEINTQYDFVFGTIAELDEALKSMRKFDEKIEITSQHETMRLQDLANIKILSRRQGEAWPPQGLEQNDVIISLIWNDKWTSKSGEQFLAKVPDWTRICRIRMKKDSPLSHELCEIFFRTPFIKGRFESLTQGSSTRSIPREVILNLLVPIPPAAIQTSVLEIPKILQKIEIPIEDLSRTMDDFCGSIENLLTAMMFGTNS